MFVAIEEVLKNEKRVFSLSGQPSHIDSHIEDEMLADERDEILEDVPDIRDTEREGRKRLADERVSLYPPHQLDARVYGNLQYIHAQEAGRRRIRGSVYSEKIN